MALDVPPVAWVVVTLLALAWAKVLLPDHLFRRRAQSSSQYVQLTSHLEPAARARFPAPQAAPPASAGERKWWTLELLRDLDAPRLEAVVRAFWQVRGFKVERNGSDLLIYRPASGELFAVALCQPAHADPVSLQLLHGLWDLAIQTAAPLAFFYGMPGFTQVALAYAKDRPMKLISAVDFLAEIGALKPAQQQQVLDRSLRPASLAPKAAGLSPGSPAPH